MGINRNHIIKNFVVFLLLTIGVCFSFISSSQKTIVSHKDNCCYKFQQTAVIICDVWDRHWQKALNDRIEPLAIKINEFVSKIRKGKGKIVHAPSDVVEFYAESPARKRAIRAKKNLLSQYIIPTTNAWSNVPAPSLCSDKYETSEAVKGCSIHEPVWTKQHDRIKINQNKDIISVNPNEIFSYFKENNIKTLVYVGIAANICVLNRDFAIKKALSLGFKPLLIKDLTDVVYSPKYNNNIEHNKALEMVLEYIKKNFCQVISSEEFLSL